MSKLAVFLVISSLVATYVTLVIKPPKNLQVILGLAVGCWAMKACLNSPVIKDGKLLTSALLIYACISHSSCGLVARHP